VRRVLSSFWLWLLAVAIVGAMVGFFAPATSTSRQRIAHLESIVRCPACEDLSVAQSNAASSIAVRHQIVAGVEHGRSDTAILTEIEHEYGPAILLSPTGGGLVNLLWAVPVAIFVVGLVLYGRLARRRP
jgi:cytochrome c-type biogenesis protein CcmH